MTLVDEIKADLKREEGFRAHGYRDSRRVLTIGYGRNIDARRGGPGITEEEASSMLFRDVVSTMINVEHQWPWSMRLGEARRSVLIQMAFQLGMAGLAKFKRMLAALEAGKFDTAAKELLDSKFAEQVPERAKRLADKLLEAPPWGAGWQ